VAGLWCIAPGQELARWGWDDEFALYNNLSGDTHLLDADSMALLAHLQQAPASVASLAEHFSDGIEPEDASALPETIAALLDQLKNFYLVVSC
jgi:PqqD family protein of HPr-rel-A system